MLILARRRFSEPNRPEFLNFVVAWFVEPTPSASQRQTVPANRGWCWGRSVSDIFQEVDEEVRREQLKKLWERYGTYIIAALILVIVAVGGWRGYEWWQAKRAAGACGVRTGSDARGIREAPGVGSGVRQTRHRRHRRLSRAGALARGRRARPDRSQRRGQSL